MYQTESLTQVVCLFRSVYQTLAKIYLLCLEYIIATCVNVILRSRITEGLVPHGKGPVEKEQTKNTARRLGYVWHPRLSPGCQNLALPSTAIDPSENIVQNWPYPTICPLGI